MKSDNTYPAWAPGALSLLSILRIFTGLDLLQHGTGKILGFPVAPMFANVQIGSNITPARGGRGAPTNRESADRRISGS